MDFGKDIVEVKHSTHYIISEHTWYQDDLFLVILTLIT